MTMTSPYTLTRTSFTGRDHALALLALLQTALFLVPMIVLGRAIGWPASLRLPAADSLPLIAGNAGAVQIGYGAYLLVSLALIPFALALRRFAHRRGVEGLLVDCAAALGIAAAVFKMLGIMRWLSAMPALAELHGSTGDPAIRAMIETSYVALNAYAGALGELLGVQLVGGLFLIAAGRILTLAGLRWTGWAGVVVGLSFLATAGRIVRPELGMMQMVAVPLALCWFAALAGAVWRKA